MKTIVISFRPSSVCDILNGKKSYEYRKSVPETPCRVLIYCTVGGGKKLVHTNKIVYGKEFGRYELANGGDALNGRIVAGFTIDRAEAVFYRNYPKERKGYAWHISDLEIFAEPKTLADFGLKRAPMGWKRI